MAWTFECCWWKHFHEDSVFSSVKYFSFLLMTHWNCLMQKLNSYYIDLSSSRCNIIWQGLRQWNWHRFFYQNMNGNRHGWFPGLFSCIIDVSLNRLWRWLKIKYCPWLVKQYFISSGSRKSINWSSSSSFEAWCWPLSGD